MTALAALIVVGGLFVWFSRLERSGRGPAVVGILFAIVLLEAVIYQDPNEVPLGLFHPEYREQSFRLPDVVIPIAIVARLLHRPRGPGSPGALLWLTFLVWLAATGLVGASEGNPLSIVAFQGKAVVYLGAFLVAAGVPIAEYVADRRLERFLAGAAALALLVIATDVGGLAVNATLPLLPLRGFGALGSDAATMFTSLGAIALALAMLASERRLRALAIAGVLLFTPAIAGQRAAFVALGVAVAIVLVAMLLSRRRLRVTPTEAGLAAAAVAGLLLISTVPAVVGQRTVKLPLQDRISTTFGAYEEVLTTKDRINQWTAARPLIAERPVYGHGLGYQYVFWNQGFFVFTKTDQTHNIFVDLLLRTGVVGLALFLLALGATSVSLARGWLSHPSDRTAAFALGVGAAVAGLIGKGMAESVFEKYRLAAMLGLGIGAMMSAGLPARAASAAVSRRTLSARREAGRSASRRASVPGDSR